MNKLHIFDLDGTLVRGNSSFGLFLYLVRKRKLSWVFIFRAIYLFWAFRRKKISLVEFHHLVFQLFVRGRKKQLFEDEIESFLDEWLECRLNKKVLDLGEGERVLLSSSPDFLVGAIARRLGIACWKGSEYAVDEMGIFSHISLIMDGKEKLKWARIFAKGRAVCAYSDSDEDLPLLEWADIVCVVNPNKELHKVARKKGWLEVK